jgi:hypothetical protein
MLILNINHPPCSYFSFFAKIVLLEVVRPLKISQNTKFDGPALTGASFASPQKFERPPFWNGCSYSIKNYDIGTQIGWCSH